MPADIETISFEYYNLRRWWWRAPALAKLFAFACVLMFFGFFTPLHVLAWIGALFIVIYVAYFVVWLSPIF